VTRFDSNSPQFAASQLEIKIFAGAEDMHRLIYCALMPLMAIPASAACNKSGTYINRDGHEVPSPRCVQNDTAGARYVCRDGSLSHAEHRTGACSRHGGVEKALVDD
jgi:hypothetical protein